jgi:dipeptidase D
MPESLAALPAAYANLEPAEVWRHFGALNSIPRPSGHEDGARAYVQRVAEEHQAMWKTDARGNIVVRVPPRGGKDSSPVVVLQSHLDMVCQKRPDVTHDFLKDPITPRRLGDQIFASGTTLGADNGVGAAMALAVLTAPGLTHGPLELLFTVEEETGLYGAANLNPELIRGRRLINLDSEDPKEITIGCAGGAGTSIFLDLKFEDLPTDFVVREIIVTGLKGGHSGIQIAEPLANSLKLLSRVLEAVATAAPQLRLISVDGGTAHNAIPRDAHGVVAYPAAASEAFEAAFRKAVESIKREWIGHESGLSISHKAASASQVQTAESSAATRQLLRELPHGVHRFSERFAGKVETSSNLAEVHTAAAELDIHVSNRSFLAGEMQSAQDRVARVAKSVGARIQVRDGYPGWEPRAESPLREATITAAARVYGQSPVVEVVHAGLECGILSEKLSGLDAVSFGPLIGGAHTPEEWVSISSTKETWKVLVELLKELA